MKFRLKFKLGVSKSVNAEQCNKTRGLTAASDALAAELLVPLRLGGPRSGSIRRDALGVASVVDLLPSSVPLGPGGGCRRREQVSEMVK